MPRTVFGALSAKQLEALSQIAQGQWVEYRSVTVQSLIRRRLVKWDYDYGRLFVSPDTLASFREWQGRRKRQEPGQQGGLWDA